MEIEFSNLDLVSVGVVIAGMLILGFVTFFSNPKSVSSKVFLSLSIFASVWGAVNYASYQIAIPAVSFWLLRFVLLFGLIASFLAFMLAYVFPEEKVVFPRWFRFVLMPVIVAAGIMTMTPFIFYQVAGTDNGHVSNIINGPGIILFGILLGFLNIGAIVLLIRRTLTAAGDQLRALRIFLLGIAMMVILILIFNFGLPALFENTRYIKYGALFLFPFIALTAYAMLRHHLLNVKVIATGILAFALSVISLGELVLSNSLGAISFRSSIFILTLLFSILLIQSVRKEVEQREELERLDKQLEEKNKQLDELSHFKSELLSLASHQIRSPLAAVKGFLSLVIGGTYGAIDPKAKEALEKARHSADELIELINTLLDLRKVEEGKMEYTFAPADIRKMAQDVFALLEPLAVTKNLEFKLIAPDHPIWVSADEQKLKQIVQNLTDNAIKYTPNGFVHIELKEENMPGTENIVKGDKIGTVTLAVSDSGFGMSAELIPHLFEEFMRDARVKTQIRGTGLGLFIARKIAEAHGGKIWAESPGEGKGSTFFLSLPEIKQ